MRMCQEYYFKQIKTLYLYSCGNNESFARKTMYIHCIYSKYVVFSLGTGSLNLAGAKCVIDRAAL